MQDGTGPDAARRALFCLPDPSKLLKLEKVVTGGQGVEAADAAVFGPQQVFGSRTVERLEAETPRQ